MKISEREMCLMAYKSKAFTGLLFFLTIVVPLSTVASKSLACSTIMLKREGILLVGHNLDETTDFEGFVCVNKRDYYKSTTTFPGV